ncbi:MAG TPA: hypothetical protein ENJ51_00915 [Leucothrix mucor]|uniref:Uncharacterized protein n=1 Tax=Leucothrix mucor TaxID=45248 RepID=A0A7V2SXQ3_LEUMU|nr:hypothetical protein [Leucothrix mucor]
MKKSIQTISLIGLAISILVSSAQAAQVSKNSGPTTPVNADFSANALSYPYMSSGYNDPNINRMFLETFKIKRCKVASAKFKIHLKRKARQGGNDALHLMSNGGAYHSVHPIWSTSSTQQTIVYNFTATNLAKISNGRFSFLVQDDTTVKSAKLTYKCKEKPRRKGMTWIKNSIDNVTGVVDVGCDNNSNHTNKCNPRQGDHMCSTKLPILCTKKLGLAKPVADSKYHRWSGNVVATTPKVAPNSLGSTLADANQYCASKFGSGWRVAEFHDGWGWHFKAYGNTGSLSKRFWVNVNDQPNANCWTQ